MAVIFICDRCGKEKRLEAAAWDAGHAAREHNLDYQTLVASYRTKGVSDVCGGCFKLFEKAKREAENEARSIKDNCIKRALAKLTA